MAHKNYPYLLASPDGINIKEGNDRYGRMVEVKNPTTRELTVFQKKNIGYKCSYKWKYGILKNVIS